MSNIDFQNGFALGVASKGQAQGVAQNPLEYTKAMRSTFQSTEFPDGYTLTITLPNCTDFYCCFYKSTGLRAITLKELTEETAVSIQGAFRETDLETIDFDNKTIKVLNGADSFRKSNVLKYINGTFDLTEATNVTNMFEAALLEEVRFKANSIKMSIIFSKSPLLSNESIQSIIDGLATVETAQTLTLSSNIIVSDTQKAIIESKGWTLVQ
jgi:hypothetical protein